MKKGLKKKNDREASKWFKKAGDLDHAKAQYQLGLMYKNGQGVPQNDKEAINRYNKSALRGNEMTIMQLKKPVQ